MKYKNNMDKNEYIISLYNKGYDLFTAGRYDESLKCFDKVIKLSPSSVNALNSKGNVLIYQGQV